VSLQNVDRFTPVTQHIFDLMESRKAQLGLLDVWYGDQVLNPRTPSLTVESGAFERVFAGVSGKGTTENAIRVTLIIYIAKIGDTQVNLKDSELMAEEIMDILHEDVNLGGLVLSSYVRSIEPGVIRKGASLMRATRISWQGMTKTRII